MSLFDQQPMGPIPARRPILLPPDPELEAATDDPVSAQIDLVGPLPPELAHATAMPPHPRAAERSLRALLGMLLLAGFLPGLVVGIAIFIPDGTRMYLPRVIAFGTVLAITALAGVVWQLRNRRRPPH